MKLLKNFPNLFQYQKIAIERGISNINRVNAHAEHTMTGLGKTVICGTIALNVAENGSILVISPKSLQKDWNRAMDGVANVTVCTKAKIPFAKYDCIIVDEAHHFQKRENKSYMELFSIVCESKCPVILATATPFQNSIEGLVSMYGIAWFKQDSLVFQTLGEVANMAMQAHKAVSTIERYNSSDTPGLMDSFKSIGDHVKAKWDLRRNTTQLGEIIGTFSNRFTWEGIAEAYPNDMERMGGFPAMDNASIEYGSSYSSLVRETERDIESLALPLHKSDDNIGLAPLFKSFLFKRLDSSIEAFKKSIASYKDKLETFELPEMNESTATLIASIASDIEICHSLLKKWDSVDDSEKLAELCNYISHKEGKIIVFSEYRDTAKAIFNALAKFDGCIYFDGESSEKDLESIVESFDPSSDKEGKHRILVCTDSLSEGVSLHRASTLVHFDMKWNPQRMVQRNGRINRIGNRSKSVEVATFSVPSIIESIINLEHKIEVKTELSQFFIDGLAKPLALARFEGIEWGHIYSFKKPKSDSEKIVAVRTTDGDVALRQILFSLEDHGFRSPMLLDDGFMSGSVIMSNSERPNNPYNGTFNYDYRVGNKRAWDYARHLSYTYKYTKDNETRHIKSEASKKIRLNNPLYGKSVYNYMEAIIKKMVNVDRPTWDSHIDELERFYRLMAEDYDSSIVSVFI